MNFRDYAAASKRFARYPRNEMGLPYVALGLAGEAGEAVEHVKKSLRKGGKLKREEFLFELGDVLWYLTRAAEEVDSSLNEVAEMNLEKLEKRYADRS